MDEITAPPQWTDEAWVARARAFAESLEVEPEHLGLMIRALTHRSMSEVAPGCDNERLEFLGDSVVALLVNDYLFHTFPERAEGQLTRLKQQYVCEASLARAAEALDLGNLLAMAPADEAAGLRQRPSTLSDAFEAVLAALYLVRGLEAAREFVMRELVPRVDPAEVLDYKSRLQELFQERQRLTPVYHTSAAAGPAHDRTFYSEARVDGRVLGTGTGRSKKAAEQAAAADSWARLEPPAEDEAAPPAEETSAPAEEVAAGD